MPVLLKLIHRFNTIPIKILAANFVDIDKLVLKFIWKSKLPRLAIKTLKKKSKVVGLNTILFQILL